MLIKTRKFKKTLTFKTGFFLTDLWKHKVLITKATGNNMPRSITGTKKECKVQVRQTTWWYQWNKSIKIVSVKCNLV